MGYYFVGVQQGELLEGNLSPESVHQIEETTRLLRESKIGNSLPSSIASDGSPEGDATAGLLADLLGIGEVRINEELLHPRVRARLKPRRIRRFWVKPKETETIATEGWFPILREKVKHGDPLLDITPGNPRVYIAVCQGELLQAYLMAFYDKYMKLYTEENLVLQPGEAFISEQHYEWGVQVREIFLSKGREDILSE